MLETERLILRQWRDTDLDVWVAMNQDPKVMEFFPRILTEEESLAAAGRIRTRIEENGWGLWAVEVKNESPFIGFVGLSQQDFGQPWNPCIEIGWRLQSAAWGKGYATEAAKSVLEFGLSRFDIIYSVTSETNLKSQAVMRRIGLIERPELAFDHPRVEDAPLKRHVVYSTN